MKFKFIVQGIILPLCFHWLTTNEKCHQGILMVSIYNNLGVGANCILLNLDGGKFVDINKKSKERYFKWKYLKKGIFPCLGGQKNGANGVRESL